MNNDENKMMEKSLDFFSEILSVKSSTNIQNKIESDQKKLMKNLMGKTIKE